MWKVIADDVLTGEPENVIRRIVARDSLQKAIAVCQAVRPIDCRHFVSEKLPDRIEYMRLIQDPVVIEELVISVLYRLDVQQWSHRIKWMKILARLHPFVVKNQRSGLLHEMASDLLSYTFNELFDLRTLRNVPQIADKYGLTRVHALLKELGSPSTPQIFPHFVVLPADEIRDLKPLGRAPTIADLTLDLSAILPAFENRDKLVVPVFIVSHASKQTKAFKNAPLSPIRQTMSFSDLSTKEPESLFSQAIALGCVRELCDAYVNEDARSLLFAFFCSAISRSLWHLSALIGHWMENRRSLFFERFSDDGERRKFVRLLVKLLESAPAVERRGIPASMILPSEHVLNASVDDLRALRMLHQSQQTLEVSIFDPQAFILLMKQGKFEIAFRIARARHIDITSIFFRFASLERDLCGVILKIMPYLTDSQLETVIQSVAPILEMTCSKESIDAFMKQLICTITDESRVFHVLIWFERFEEAFVYAVFRNLHQCVFEIWAGGRLRNDTVLEARCRRLLRLYRIPFDDEEL
jgi:hypothetical protein